MKVALIHAMTESVKPIEKAFRKVAPNVTLVHFMDTGLLSFLEEQGGITPTVIRRFTKMLDTAIDSGVDLIQLTCSAFNHLAHELQPFYEVKIFRSDEAMLDEALNYQRIGLVSTVAATPLPLKNYLISKNPDIIIESLVNEEALRLMKKGEQSEHDQLIKNMIDKLEEKVDVIVLSQYSMAHVSTNVECKTPILTGPILTAERCLKHLHTT